MARNFSLVILGKGGGRRDSAIVRTARCAAHAGLAGGSWGQLRRGAPHHQHPRAVSCRSNVLACQPLVLPQPPASLSAPPCTASTPTQVRIPPELVEAGLITQHAKLPFQARRGRQRRSGGWRAGLHLEVLHSCALPSPLPTTWPTQCLLTTSPPLPSPCPAGVPQGAAQLALLPTNAPLPSRLHLVWLQEYYEVLHSCVAVVPAFADDAYYVNKVGAGGVSLDCSIIRVCCHPSAHSEARGRGAGGSTSRPRTHVYPSARPSPRRRPQGSSSIGASLISGSPLVAHRYMLKSYK